MRRTDAITNINEQAGLIGENIKFHPLLKPISLFCLIILPCVVLFPFLTTIGIIQIVNLAWPMGSGQEILQKILIWLLSAVINCTYFYFEITNRMTPFKSLDAKTLSIPIKIAISLVGLVLFNFFVGYAYYSSSPGVLVSLGFSIFLLLFTLILIARTVLEYITYRKMENNEDPDLRIGASNRKHRLSNLFFISNSVLALLLLSANILLIFLVVLQNSSNNV